MGIGLGIVLLDMVGKAGLVERGLAHFCNERAIVNSYKEAFDDGLDDLGLPIFVGVEAHYVYVGPNFLPLEDGRDSLEI